jgi:hypothetical protein
MLATLSSSSSSSNDKSRPCKVLLKPCAFSGFAAATTAATDSATAVANGRNNMSDATKRTKVLLLVSCTQQSITAVSLSVCIHRNCIAVVRCHNVVRLAAALITACSRFACCLHNVYCCSQAPVPTAMQKELPASPTVLPTALQVLVQLLILLVLLLLTLSR